MLLGSFLALVYIKFAEKVFLSSNSIPRMNGRSEEFALALRATSHRWNCAFVSQNDEATLCHGIHYGTNAH